MKILHITCIAFFALAASAKEELDITKIFSSFPRIPMKVIATLHNEQYDRHITFKFEWMYETEIDRKSITSSIKYHDSWNYVHKALIDFDNVGLGIHFSGELSYGYDTEEKKVWMDCGIVFPSLHMKDRWSPEKYEKALDEYWNPIFNRLHEIALTEKS